MKAMKASRVRIDVTVYAGHLREAIASSLPAKGLALIDGSRCGRWPDRLLVIAAILVSWAAGSSMLDRFAAAITPRTRVIEVTHITNLTGQILPVRDIIAMARPKGIAVFVDGAHAFAHFPFDRDALDCDYYGTSLHKWLLAPIGTGFLYVRRENIESLWGLTPTAAARAGDIRKFEEIGTHPAANHNAIAEALSFHEGMGIERKSARLRYLRNRWAARLQKTGRFKIHTPMDPAQSCAIGTVQVLSVPTGKAVQTLWDKWRIIATPIVHAEYEGIRVTPNVYTTLEEIDTFAEAMESL